MFFEISDDAISAAVSSTSSAGRLEVIAHLLSAHREGRHVVSLGLLASQLMRVDALSLINKGTVRSIVSQRSELLGLRRILSRFVIVTEGDVFETSFRDGSIVWKTGIDWLTGSEQHRESILLSEHQTDAQIYLRLSEAYVASQRWRIRLKAETRGGGGSTTRIELLQLATRRQLALCVADADREHPGGPDGATASALRECEPSLNVQALHVPDAREIENLVPAAIMVDAVTDVLKSGVDHLERLRLRSEALSRDLIRYVDLKRGLRGGDISKNRRPETRHYLAIVAGKGSAMHCPIDSGEVICAKIDDCTCELLPSIGASTMNAVAEWMGRKSAHKIAEYCRFDQDVILKSVAEAVVALCCSAVPRAA